MCFIRHAISIFTSNVSNQHLIGRVLTALLVSFTSNWSKVIEQCKLPTLGRVLAALVASGRTHLSPPFPLFTALGDATHPLCLLLIGPTRSTDLLLLQKEQKFAWYRLICLTARACHFCWGTGQGIFQNKTLNEEQFSLSPLKAVALKLSPPNSN